MYHYRCFKNEEKETGNDQNIFLSELHRVTDMAKYYIVIYIYIYIYTRIYIYIYYIYVLNITHVCMYRHMEYTSKHVLYIYFLSIP